jgi:hypothetical protein
MSSLAEAENTANSESWDEPVKTEFSCKYLCHDTMCSSSGGCKNIHRFEEPIALLADGENKKYPGYCMIAAGEKPYTC